MKSGAGSGGREWRRACATAVLFVLAGAASAQTTQPATQPSRWAVTGQEVHDVEVLLSQHPQGVGKPIADRAAWEALGALKHFQAFAIQAERLRNQPIAEIPDDLYLEFSRTGNRTKWQNAERERCNRLKPLVLGECIQNQGRFLPAIEQLIDAICAERTWVLPAHDRELRSFHGEQMINDLWSTALAWDLATADCLLGDKLTAQTRRKIRENIRRRVLDPFLVTARTGDRAGNGWVSAKHNWNAVCLAGVTGAAMQQVESRRERAEFLAAAVKYSENYLKGFPEDAYCHEGLGYWEYGFGHYVLLAETIRQATGGKVDLMDRSLVSEAARFPLRIQILNGVYPAFADCNVRVRPGRNIMYYINRRWGLGLSQYSATRGEGHLAETMVYAFDGASETPPGAPATAPATALRDWFDKTGILVCRPADSSPCRMGVAILGANNGEVHSHNDIGSYVVVVGSQAVLLDPGGEGYTARTFSPRRYESNLLNSFGHPVPVVAGQLQREGPKSRAEIRKAEFSDSADRLEMEIASAYPAAEGLRSLLRTFVYSRAGQGALTVTDQVEFATPQSFGTALITAGTCRQTDDGSLIVQTGTEAVKVTLDAGGEPFEIKIEPIEEETSIKPVRIGVNLVRPVTAARITVRIEPTAAT